MTMLPVLPDAELLLIQHIRNHAGLTSLLTGGHVSNVLGSARPFVQVTRVGGTPLDGQEDHARLQVATWATTDSAASLLARTIVATLPDVIGSEVRGWELVLGPFPQPDDNDARYIFDVEMLIYANGG